MRRIFKKKLTKTDIKKRLSVPSEKKECFLDFRGQHEVNFEVVDDKGKVRLMKCSKRKKDKYPKFAVGKEWLQFVRERELAVGDEVILYKEHDKAGERPYRIKVIKRAKQPPVQNHDGSVTTEVDIEEKPLPALIYDSADQSINGADQTERAHYQYQPAVTDMVGPISAFASAEPRVRNRELVFIDFFEREKEQYRSPTPLQFL